MENTTNNKFTVVGLFNDKDSAECAYDALSKRGYGEKDIDVMMSDITRDKYYSGADAGDTELGSKAAEGTGAGAAIGGTIGAVIAAIAAIGTSVVLPGLGLIVAGPVAAALVGGGIGGITGGLVGALVGSGIPEEHAEAYESGIKSGGIVLRAYSKDAADAAFIENKWEACGGVQIFSNAAQTTAATATSATAPRKDANNAAIPVIEEELVVGKRTVESGGVNVRTNITEHPVEKTVSLRDEEIHVERRPVDRAVTDADMAAVKDGNFTVVERDEQAVVAKDARVVGEVSIGKNITERTETVSDTVRHTDVDVEKLSDKEV